MVLEAYAPAERRRLVVLAGHQRDEAVALEGWTDDDGKVRAAALGALERIGTLEDDLLATALQDAEPAVRRRAAELGATHPDVPLTTTLGDDDPLVVEAACWASGEREAHPEPGIVAALSVVAADHEDALCREAAVAALGALGLEEGLPAILAATQDKPAVRRRAVLALAPFEGEAVDQALARAQEDRDLQVRQAAEDLVSPENDSLRSSFTDEP
jgi:HEAT repeat protein